MKLAKRFFKKYLLSTLIILILFFVLNIILICGTLLMAWNNSTDPDIPVQTISKNITLNVDGTISSTDYIENILKNKSAWAMILNEQGNVIWEKFLPEELPRTYSNLQIAKFSRWYLQEYPVFIQEHSAGLLVIGCEPNSITKYNFSIDINYIHSLIVGIFLMICFNILLIFILFWRNTHRIEKSIVPIIDGIDSIAQGKPITLSETGELSSINAELNKAGKHLLQKEQARAEWINGVSHDVRTPLSIILGYASEIEKNEDASQPVQLQASIIRKQSEKLRSLIADLNLTSRLEYSMQPLIKTSFSPVEIARQVIIGFMNGPIDNKYSFDFHSSSDMIPVLIKGDTELFSRMLSNLIQNCINHNPHGCEITVEILKENDTCIISVIDNGGGMTSTQIEKMNSGIFPNNMYNSNGESVHGFGLKLVYQILTAHNGNIKYENILPHGLKVILEIPIEHIDPYEEKIS